MENITKVYNENYESILFFISRKVNDRMAAEEIAADTFIKANEHLSEFNPETSKMTTWLHFIANNLIIDYWRTNYNEKRVLVSGFVNDKGEETFQYVSNESEAADYDMEREELKNKINRALAGLKPKYRKVLELYFIDGKKYREIAEELDVSMSNVKVMINRGRKQIIEALQTNYVRVECSNGVNC